MLATNSFWPVIFILSSSFHDRRQQGAVVVGRGSARVSGVAVVGEGELDHPVEYVGLDAEGGETGGNAEAPVHRVEGVGKVAGHAHRRTESREFVADMAG